MANEKNRMFNDYTSSYIFLYVKRVVKDINVCFNATELNKL